MENMHIPVMLDKFLSFLPQSHLKQFIFIDCTLGFGGHSDSVMKIYRNVQLIGIDRDRDAIKFSSNKLSDYNDRIKIIHGKFGDLQSILIENNCTSVDFMLIDLGLSSYQIDSFDRGFSYKFKDSLLDMRMDNNDNLTAFKILNDYDREALISVFSKVKEIRCINRLVDSIIIRRKKTPWEYAKEFVDLCEGFSNYYSGRKNRKILSSSLCFQALRMEVNKEIDELFNVLISSSKLLSEQGKLIVISYNSLEDGIVKNFFKIKSGIKVDFNNYKLENIFNNYKISQENIFNIITKKPLRPINSEINNNSRASSARMRVIERKYL